VPLKENAMAKKAKSAQSRCGPWAGRKPRVLPRTPPTFNTLPDEDDTGAADTGPAATITQAELEAYMAEEKELAVRLKRFAERRRQLMGRLWDRAAVEDGSLAAGLIPAFSAARRGFSPDAVCAEISYGRLAGVKFGKKPLRLLIGDAAWLASTCRLHGVSKACPEGTEPATPLLEVVLI
jgi:hypothetical protein